jgi:hypothetical protein
MAARGRKAFQRPLGSRAGVQAHQRGAEREAEIQVRWFCKSVALAQASGFFWKPSCLRAFRSRLSVCWKDRPRGLKENDLDPLCTAPMPVLTRRNSLPGGASIASRGGLALEAHQTPQQLFTDTDLGGHVSHWAASLNHQAGSLLPKLRSVLSALARHKDILPAGPAAPPVRCPPSGVNPSRWVERCCSG